MNDQNKEDSTNKKNETSAEYVAPEIEAVVTAGDLDREVQYAGNVSQQKR